MAVRWRNNGRGVIVCAAEHKAQRGDLYIDDGLHYALTQKKILVTFDDGNTWQFGQDNKHFKKEDIEYMLRASRFECFRETIPQSNSLRNRWTLKGEHRLLTVDLPVKDKHGRRNIIIFNNWIHIPYSDLTPEKWERYTGLKFHGRKK